MAAYTFAAALRPTQQEQQQQQAPPRPSPDVARRPSGGAWSSAPQLAAPPAALPRPRLRRAAPRAPSRAAAPAREPRRGAALPPQVLSDDPARAAARLAARAPWVWGLPAEGANLGDPEVSDAIWRGLAYEGAPGAPAQALLTAHYSLHGGFLLDAPILDDTLMAPLRDRVVCIAVQGGADIVCPPTSAFALSEAWPEAEVAVIGGAGHSMYDPAVTHELVTATDRLRALWP
jgi:proline iminopeptidase